MSPSELSVLGSREREVTDALVSLSSIGTGFVVADLLDEVAADCVRLLDVASAGLFLADPSGALRLLAASSERTQNLGTFEVECKEGPCTECFVTGRAIQVPDIDLDQDRWPSFTAGARMAGFASVHALPMRLHGTVLGVLGLFGTTKGSLSSNDLSLGQALADIASVALVHERDTAGKTALADQLQSALDGRVSIDRAKDLLMQRGADNRLESFAVLRKYARDHNLRVTGVAASVLSGALGADSLIEYARMRGVG